MYSVCQCRDVSFGSIDLVFTKSEYHDQTEIHALTCFETSLLKKVRFRELEIICLIFIFYRFMRLPFHPNMMQI